MLKVVRLEHKYRKEHELGKGTFGDVYSASVLDGTSGMPSVVAIKQLRGTSDEKKFQYLREVIFYRNIPPHGNIVRMFDLFQDEVSLNVVFVLERMDGTLYQFMKDWRSRTRKGLETPVVAKLMKHICYGLEHIHKYGFVHRDLKPENILYSRGQNGRIHVKLADFGLSRPSEKPGDPPSSRPWTSYVATRWYRAPEQILGVHTHTPALDMWAVGCILYEISQMEPLFPGETSEKMVSRFISKLGMPVEGSFGGRSDDLVQKLGSIYPSSVPKAALANMGALWHISWRYTGHHMFRDALRSVLQWDAAQRADAECFIARLNRVIDNFVAMKK